MYRYQKMKGSADIVGPSLEYDTYTKPLRVQKVNIGMEEKPKFANIGDYVGSINPPARRKRARYIIIVTDYLTRWVEEEPVTHCSAKTVVHFLFENIVTRFGCPKVLMSDQGTHFVKNTIVELTK
jgi:hypothetical protein